MPDIKTGKVKWFNASKGYGFILIEGTKKEVLVNANDILCDGLRCLSDGDMVRFELVESPSGMQAKKVEKIN